MFSKLLSTRSGRALVLTAAAATSFILSALIYRHGIEAWPDSWYYWIGSVNLIEHGTFTTMLGLQIQDWMPLFSLYLILFEKLFGQTGWALILAMCVLVAANVAVWGAYIFKVFPEDEKPSVVGIMGSLIFLALFLPIGCISLMSNALLLLFVGFIVHLLAAISEDSTRWGGVVKSFFVAILLAAGIFTHNSGIIYVVATLIVIPLCMPTPLLQRALAVALILFVCGLAWMNFPSHGIRSSANPAMKGPNAQDVLAAETTKPVALEGSHRLFEPYFSFREYLVQAPSGIGTFFISAHSVAVQVVIGLAILAMAMLWLIQRPRTKLESRHKVFLGFALLVLAGHFVIFNIVFIFSALADRFSWYFALIIVPIFFYRFRRSKWILLVLILATVGVSSWRACKLVRTGKIPALAANAKEVDEHEIHQEYFLTSKPNPVVPEGSIQIDPPLYTWQKTLSGFPPANPHSAVRLIRPGTDQR